MRILNMVGARSNFIKIAPLIREMRKHNSIALILVHAGQEYDVKMAGRFIDDLGIPDPNVLLDVGPGSNAFQTTEVIKRLEPVMEGQRSDLVLAVGDVNSTLAGAVATAKLRIPMAHGEAGLQSFDRTMSEEVHLLVTDTVSNYFFVGRRVEYGTLRRKVSIRAWLFVGNVMIDFLEAFCRMWERPSIRKQLGAMKGQYGVLTLPGRQMWINLPC